MSSEVTAATEVAERRAGGKRIVVVLGMHRSGTSAIARGLKVLGVELGDRLMPPVANNNEKGFWEDVDVHALDDDVLKHLGHGWDSLRPIERSVLLGKNLAPFRLRAVDLLRGKLAGTNVFGLKDPRISRLLPFWMAAFRDAGAEAGYVISVRHPLSVADSLSRRDAMEPSKSHYLWLDHTIASMRNTAGEPRVIVDYDLLMTQPEQQLQRIAKALELPFDPRSSGMAEYTREFLSEGLRHSVHGPEDIRKAVDVPGEVVGAYSLLLQLARDEVPDQSQAIHDQFAELESRLLGVQPALSLISRFEGQIAALHTEVGGRDATIAYLNAETGIRDGIIADLNRELKRLAAGYDLLRLEVQAALELEASHAREAATCIATSIAPGAPVPPEHQAATRALEQYRDGMIRVSKGLMDAPVLAGIESQGIVAWLGEALKEWRHAQVQLTVVIEDLERSFLESEREREIGQLRLLDSLREGSRGAARIAQLQASLAMREADIRTREGIIAERQAEVERLDRILGQAGHRLVSRIGRLLAPYPGLRSLLRAPLRLMQRFGGQSGNTRA